MESALDFPLGETATHWIVHSWIPRPCLLVTPPFDGVEVDAIHTPTQRLRGELASPPQRRFTEIDYLETYAANPGDIYGASSIDGAAKNTFTSVWK